MIVPCRPLIYSALAACLWAASAPAQTAPSDSSSELEAEETGWVAPEDYVIEEAEPKWWWKLVGPAKTTAEEQLAYCESLITKGRIKKAITHLDRLANFWPESEAAGKALQRKAELLAEKDKPIQAFRTYQAMMERYAGEFDYERILERQFELAEEARTRRYSKFLFFPGVKDSPRSIPLYEAIVTNAPHWVRSPEALYTTGRIREREDQYEEAIIQYGKVTARYPSGDYAKKASFGKALCRYQIAKRQPNDDASAEAAWAAMLVHLNRYPEAEENEEVYAMMKLMRSRLARSYYRKAMYYDEIEKNPRAALVAYKALVEEFPNSEWTAVVSTRIKTLSRQLNEPIPEEISTP